MSAERCACRQLRSRFGRRCFHNRRGRRSAVVARACVGAGGETASEAVSAAARDALSKFLGGRTVTIAPAESLRDRYGRTVAQVFADGTWVQAALLRAGEVRAAPDRASASCASALLAAEAEGREHRAGQWRGGFRVQDPEGIRNRVGSFQIVEGSVVTASVTRGCARARGQASPGSRLGRVL
jgi:hypothetical protein